MTVTEATTSAILQPVCVEAGPLGKPASKSRVCRWFALLMVCTILVCFWDMRGGPQFDAMDCWVAQTAREMRESGRWVLPLFSGETRLQKSPGAYWAVMLAGMLRGGPMDEVAARIPDATAVVVLVTAIFLFTRTVAGDRAAIFAGFAAASSVLCLACSHRASSDVGLMTWVAVALMSWWCAADAQVTPWQRGGLWCLGYLAAGMGMLWKMPMPLVCVGLPALAYVVLLRRWSVLRSGWHILGLMLFLLPWLPWVVEVLRLEPDAPMKWRAEIMDRFTGDLPGAQSHRGLRSVLIYLAALFAMPLPYALSIPAAVLRPFRANDKRVRDGLLFCLIWLSSLLVFLLTSVGKETRYILPAMPPLFVLLGVELAAVFAPKSEAEQHHIRWIVRAAWLLVPAGVVGGFYGFRALLASLQVYTFEQVWPAAAVAGVIFGVGTCAAIALYQWRRPNASFGVLVGTMWATWLWACPSLLPMTTLEGTTTSLADQMVSRLPVEMRPCLRYAGGQDPRVIWRSNLRIARVVSYLDLLRRQGGKRSASAEMQIVGREMLQLLWREEPVLLVSTRSTYTQFLRTAPNLLPPGSKPFPQTYLWLQSETGGKNKQLVVFGNVPPPWPEPVAQ